MRLVGGTFSIPIIFLQMLYFSHTGHDTFQCNSSRTCPHPYPHSPHTYVVQPSITPHHYPPHTLPFSLTHSHPFITPLPLSTHSKPHITLTIYLDLIFIKYLRFFPMFIKRREGIIKKNILIWAIICSHQQ